MMTDYSHIIYFQRCSSSYASSSQAHQATQVLHTLSIKRGVHQATQVLRNLFINSGAHQAAQVFDEL